MNLAGYAVHELLRETVHSRVYRATSKADKRAMVVKLARESSPEIHAAAHQELEIIRKLDGLAVVRGVDLDYFEDHPALVMERFGGGDMEEWLAGLPLALDRFLAIAIALARTLAQVHERGVIHRDLKPGNILIDPATLEIRLADFGVAASVDGALSIQAAALIGSLAYLSPEQTGRMTRRVDSRSDLYSLGVSFYEMVTGKVPFEQTSPLELVHAHFALTPRLAHERNPAIPPVVSEVIAKLLAKNPDDRYQSAHGVAADLAQIAAQLAGRQTLGGFALGGDDRARMFLLPRKLYGRQAELALLERCLGRARGGGIELLAVGGPSGSGKSALFAEAEHSLLLHQGYFIKGKFDQLARNAPFSAVSQALAGLVDQLLAKPERELAAIVGELSAALAGLGQVVVDIAPALEKLLGPQPAVPVLGLRESQGRITEAFWRLIGALASRERPLVIVLDDLQWADAGSSFLIGALADESPRFRTVSLVLLCAFRAGELAADHPFRTLLDRIAGNPDGAAVHGHELALRPLEVGHVRELLADTLRMPGERVDQAGSLDRLAEIVLRKTSGNAFFVHHFLAHAHRLGLFRFTGDGWVWDVDAIAAAGIPDDAAGLMAEKLRALPAAICGVVTDASIIGDEVDLATLTSISEAAERDVLRAVHALVDDGLLVRAGAGYRFAHDKIREAALGLAGDERASRVHAAIGRHRLAAHGAAATGGVLFATTDHLNHARRHLSDDERLALAELNLRSGRQALAVGAVATARPYLAAGLALLDGDPWRTHFQLMFELTLEHAHAQFYAGEEEPALAAMQALLARELSLVNTAAVYLRMIAARVFREEFREAAYEGAAALAPFGIKIRIPGTHWQRVLAMIRAIRRVGREPEKLLALPECTDDVARARHQLVKALIFPFYFFNVKLSGVLTLEAARRLIDDGLTASSGIELMSYAVVIQVVLRNPELARRFANVAAELHQRLGAAPDTATLVFWRYEVIEPWHMPYRESLEPLRRATDIAHDVGNYQLVVILHVCRLYCALGEGVHLVRVERMAQAAYDACVRLGLPDEVNVIDAAREVLGVLRDQSVIQSAEDCLAELERRPLERRSITIHLVATAQIVLRLLRGDLDEAYVLADRIWDSLAERGSLVFIWMGCVARGAGAAARLAGARGGARRRYRKQLAESLGLLRKWAVHNPVFFTHKLHWLEAEQARAQGRTDAALALYARAREAAVAAEYAHVAGAIDLRRAELAHELGLAGDAAAWRRAAIQAYRAWGARALAGEIAQRYPDDVAPAQEIKRPSHPTWESTHATANGRADQLDVSALLGAAQAIAQEVTLASVLERVMANTMASAGATLGALVLDRGGALTVELRQRAGEKAERCAIAIDVEDDLPRSIVQYVQRTGETLVLADAATEGGFIADPWIKQRAARSILCAPIVKQARRVGVLFFHNALVASAFTDRHLTTLQMLASQAAISIDNAILYDELAQLNRELEARVEDRTRALRDAQQQLIESARKAGMADVAVEVLHNVGNALNSVNVSAQVVQGQLAGSKVKTLGRVVAMLDEHKDDLAGFFASDPRAGKIANMLALLHTTLLAEHDTMRHELERLHASVDTVGVAIHDLEATADDKGSAALEAPQVLVGQAIAAVRERCQREGVAIAANCDELPGARIDKHKGLDILVGLLGNALDTLAAGPTERKQVTLQLRGTAAAIELQVTDTGAGIAAQDLTRIFQFNARPDRRGANLHRFANLASAAGGNLAAASDGPGRGATLTLVLPNRGSPPSG